MPRIRTVALQGMFWLGGQRIGVRILDQVFTIVLVRILTPRDFGLVALASVLTGVFSVFTFSGLAAAIVQRREIDDEYLSTAFWANVAVGLVLFGVSAASSRFYGVFVREPLAGTLVIVLSLRFVIDAAATTQAALISRRMQYRALALRPLMGALVGGVIGVVMAFKGLGVWSLVGQMLGAGVAGAIALHYGAKWTPRLYFSWRKLRELWSFGGPILMARLFGYGIRNTDNLLVGRYLGSVALGFYALAYTVFLVPMVDIGFPMRQVMFSALSRIQEDANRLKQSFLLATGYVTMIALPVMVGLSIVAALMVEIVFGAKWLPAAPVMSILALAGFLQLMLDLGPSGLQAVGRADLHMRLAFFSLLLYVPAFAVGLRWGITGVAVGYLIATAILAPIQWRYVAPVLGVTVRELWAVIYPSVVGCAVMAAAVTSVKWVLADAGAPKIVSLVILVILGVAVYGAMTWTIQRQAVLKLVRMVSEIRTAPVGSRLRKAEGS